MVASYGPMIVAAIFEVAVVAGLALAIAVRRIAYRLSGGGRLHSHPRPRQILTGHGAPG